MILVTTDWLEKNLKNVKIFDASLKPNAKEEYLNMHIPGAIFFSIQEHSDKETDLENMLPKSDYWIKIMQSFGINNQDHIIVYDSSPLISSCRLWFCLKYFGHKKVSVLDGGMKKWLMENRETTKIVKKIIPTNNYKVNENSILVKNKNQIDENIKSKNFKVVDARGKNRFLGLEPEPRQNMRSGSIKNSVCLPFGQCINPKNNTFLNKEILKKNFESVGIIDNQNVIFTCGSGITACVLALAYSLINDKYSPVVYDGSWNEYGKIL